MSRSILRRPSALLLSALLGLGAVPLLATSAASEITDVQPAAAANNQTGVKITITSTSPILPTDTIRLVEAAYSESITCPQDQAHANYDPPLTTVVTCDLTAATPSSTNETKYEVVIDRPPSGANDPMSPVQDDLASNAFLINSSGQPTISTFTPSSRAQGTATTNTGSTITGNHFSRNMTYEFLLAGTPNNKVTFTPNTVTATTVTGTLNVAADAPTGVYDLRITTKDGLTFTKLNALTVNVKPTITDVEPNDEVKPGVGQGTTSQPNNRLVTITGTGFQPNVQVIESPDHAGLSFCDSTTCTATFVSSTTITVLATVTSAAVVGSSAHILVRNPDGGESSFELAINPRPTVASPASPASRGQGTSNQQVTVNGTNFWNIAGGPGENKETQFTISGSGVTLVSSDVQNVPAGCTTLCTQAILTVTVDNDATTGARNITAINWDGGRSTETGQLQIAAKPSVTSVNPNARARGFTGNVTVNGTGFCCDGNPPTVSFGPGVTVNSVTKAAGNTNQLTVNITVANNADQGPRTVTVTNPDGSSGSCVDCFRVDALSVTAVTPPGSNNGLSRSITFTGTGFSDAGGAPTMTLDYTGTAAQPDIVATDVIFVSPTQVTGNFDLSIAAPGTYDAVVTNKNGDSGRCSACFTVTSSTPVVTSVTPNKAPQGSQDKVLTINGSNFSEGSTVQFENAGVTVQSIDVVSPTRIDVVVDITPAASTAAGDVTVRDASGKPGTCTDCFQVTVAPTVTNVSPNTVARGVTGKNVTITGTGFVSGAVASVSGTGVTVTATSFTNATTLVATLTVAGDAPLTARTVTVTNPDGGAGSCSPECLTVVAAPTVTSVTPDKGGVGQAVNVTITGTGFTAGSYTVTAGDGITVTNVARVSDTSITATFTISAAAVPGPRNVTVTNTGTGGSGSCTGCFSVVSAPTVTSVTPNSAPQGTSPTVTITGTGFTPVSGTPNVTVSGTGVTASGGTITSPTTITGVTFTVTGGAPVGARNVTVTNPDGGSGTCLSCFTVTSSSPFVVKLFDNNGTAGTNDDTVETNKPVSGTTYRVTVTAQTSPTSGTTDTTYVGKPVLATQPADSQFTHTCANAVNGVAECTANFGDLGQHTLTASGTDADANRNGSLSIVTQPISLEWTSSPRAGGTGQPLSYTFRPVAKTGASIGGYAGVRRFQVVGTGSSRADDSVITECSSATCTFTVTFSEGGTKTIFVTDNSTPSASTPQITVEITALGRFTPLTPRRVLDTRFSNDTDGYDDQVGRGQTITVQITGGNIPANATAVAVNVTAVNSAGNSFLTVYPTGAARPNASTINFTRNEIVANLAVLKIGTAGRVNVYNSLNPADVVMDVQGFYTTGSEPGGRFIGVTPKRINPGGTVIGQNAVAKFDASSASTGVPDADVSGVVLSVTGINASHTTFLTVYPDGGSRPTASNVNPRLGGRSTANLVMVPVDALGEFNIYNRNGSLRVTADVMGYYTATSSDALGRFVPLVPGRIVDTRDGTGGVGTGKVGPGETIDPLMTGKPLLGVPSSGVSAVVINVTVDGPTARSFLTVYPSGVPKPGTSNVAFLPGQITANLAAVKLGTDERIRITNNAGEVHIIVDIVGYMTT